LIFALEEIEEFVNALELLTKAMTQTSIQSAIPPTQLVEFIFSLHENNRRAPNPTNAVGGLFIFDLVPVCRKVNSG